MNLILILIISAIILASLIVAFLLVRALQRKRTDKSDDIINTLAHDYTSLYVVNLKDETFRTIQRTTYLQENYPENMTYTAAFGLYVNKDIYKADRELMKLESSPDRIRGRLKAVHSYEIRFRETSTGACRWYVMHVERLTDKDEALIGFANKDAEIIEDIVGKHLMNDYIALYHVDLENDTYYELRQSNINPVQRTDGTNKWSSLVLDYAAICTPESKGIISKLASPLTIAMAMTKTDLITYPFEILNDQEPWRKAELHVTSRSEGIPETIICAISKMDNYAAQNEALNSELIQHTGLVDLFTSRFNASYIVDISTGAFRILKQSDALKEKYPSSMSFSEATELFIETQVYEDDKDEVRLAFTPRFVRERLENVTSFSVDFRLIDKEGKPQWQVMKIGKIGKDNNKFLVGFIVKDELDSIRKAEFEERMQKEAEKERFFFLVNLAHELRTPLSLLSMPIKSLIKNEEMSEKVEETLRRACVQADKMSVLIETAFASDGLIIGKKKIDAKKVDFKEFIERTVEKMSSIERSRKMTINISNNGPAGEVLMDEKKMELVIFNLVINAMDHNPENADVSVLIESKPEEKKVRLSVRDYGHGFPGDDLVKIFKDFNKSTEDHSGFGIGLLYSKDIVEAQGGVIGAYNNEDGRGATLWFEMKQQ